MGWVGFVTHQINVDKEVVNKTQLNSSRAQVGSCGTKSLSKELPGEDVTRIQQKSTLG